MSTLGPEVVSNLPRENLASVSPCTHEEADTRMFVHVADHTFNGFTNVALRTTDSDVVMIAISVIKHLQELSELWIAFGTGKKLQVHSSTRNSQSAGWGSSRGPSCFSQHNRLWYGISPVWERKEDRMGSMAAEPWCHVCTSMLVSCTSNDLNSCECQYPGVCSEVVWSGWHQRWCCSYGRILLSGVLI